MKGAVRCTVMVDLDLGRSTLSEKSLIHEAKITASAKDPATVARRPKQSRTLYRSISHDHVEPSRPMASPPVAGDRSPHSPRSRHLRKLPALEREGAGRLQGVSETVANASTLLHSAELPTVSVTCLEPQLEVCPLPTPMGSGLYCAAQEPHSYLCTD